MEKEFKFQDISELCAIIRNAFTLFRSSRFEHDRFTNWLSDELRSVDFQTNEEYSEEKLKKARLSVSTILTIGIGDRNLVSFLSIDELDSLPELILELFIDSLIDHSDLRRILELAVRVRAASIVKRLNVESAIGKEVFLEIWKFGFFRI